MRRYVTLFLLWVVGTVAMAAVPGTELYVAPCGNDQNAGTRQSPFCTVERARDEIRQLKKRPAGLPPGGVTVILREGVYPRGASFKLTAEDSGTADAPVTYTACPGERVTLFGGRVLRRDWFAPVEDPAVLNRVIDTDARAKLVQCDLGAHGIDGYGELKRRGFSLSVPPPPLQLFVDGRQMTLARYPNEGHLHIDTVLVKGPARGDPDFNKRGGIFTYTDDRISAWARGGDIWLNGVFSKDWEWSFNRIFAITPETRAVMLAYGEVSGLLNWKRDFFYAENLLEEIDIPGEYFVDREKGKLYFLPTDGFDKAAITVSTLADSMVQVDGAEYVSFRDLVFDTSRRSAVEGTGRAVRIESCEIVRQGLSAVRLKGDEHIIAACDIHHVGGTAISLDGGDWETLSPSGCVVENCHIHHWGDWQRVYCPGVGLNGVGHVVRHSEFDHFPHDAIEVRGNDHLIAYNLFHDGPTDFKDMGVIYGNLGASPHHRGTVIRGNFFRGAASQLPKQNAVYPDNGTMDWVIEENLFYRTGNAGEEPMGAIMTNGGAYLAIRNNIFVDCASTFKQSFFLATWNKKAVASYEQKWRDLVQRYDFTAMPHGKRYPGLLKLLEEDRVLPDSCVFERNLIWNPTVPLKHDGPYTTKGGPATLVSAKDNYIARTDPGFVNWQAGDFTLRENANLFNHILGFRPIPFDKMGRQKPAGPKARH